MIDNVEMSLAKTDGRLAERYLALGDRPDLAALVTEEMERTREWVRKATGRGEILEGRPVLRRAVRPQPVRRRALAAAAPGAPGAAHLGFRGGGPGCTRPGRPDGSGPPAPAPHGQRHRGGAAEHGVIRVRVRAAALAPPATRAGPAPSRASRLRAHGSLLWALSPPSALSSRVRPSVRPPGEALRVGTRRRSRLRRVRIRSDRRASAPCGRARAGTAGPGAD